MTFSNTSISLPLIQRAFAKSIALDLVSVQPMGSFDPQIVNEVKIENRNRKVQSIIENKEFVEMKIEDHPGYKPFPSGKLSYMDFIYGTSSNLET